MTAAARWRSLGLQGLWPALVGLVLVGCGSLAAAGVENLSAQADQPRAYGYAVGDLVSRRVLVSVPPGLSLDPESLPRPGQRGQPLELRSQSWQALGEGRYELLLHYQIFQSPTETRTLEMPTVRLRFNGTPRAETLRIEAWPVTVSPLVPVEVSPRTGLGELQPDQPPPLLDTRTTTWRLSLWAIGVALCLAYLAVVYLGGPAWARRRRPFGRAWRQVSALPGTASAAQWREAAKAVHQALNDTAGQVVFAHGLDAFLDKAPQFAPLRDAWRDFFEASRREFFAGDDTPRETAALRALCRQARDLERGSA